MRIIDLSQKYKKRFDLKRSLFDGYIMFQNNTGKDIFLVLRAAPFF